MPLNDPKFESRTYREIFDEAVARIPAHTPEWTNRSEPDPGITLLQLFSFMTESVLYRTNLIPERNRQKFLRLLQIPMRAAGAARGLVELSNPRGEFKVFTINEGHGMSAGNVPFKTENGLAVLPVESRLYYKRAIPEDRRARVDELYRNLFAAFDLPENELQFYETAIFEPAGEGSRLRSINLSKEPVDGSLWLALLCRNTETPQAAREKIANSVLSLGIAPTPTAEGSVLKPSASSDGERPELVFEIPNAADERIRYQPLEYTAEHDLLYEPGVVKLKLPSADQLTVWEEEPLTAGVDNRPPSLENTDDQARLITWIRVRSPQVELESDASSRQLDANIAWLGINAATVAQRTDVRAEQLSNGTGEPDQVQRVINTPVIKESMTLTVNGEVWKQIDELAAAPPEFENQAAATNNSQTGNVPAGSKVFRLDNEAGEIYFGNGVHGARPPAGAVIVAAYSYGGGAQGMVGIGTIKKAPSLPAGLKVSNPVPTWGGTRAETIQEAERNIPTYIRHRERLMSEQDYYDIVQRTPGVEVGRTEILSLFHPRLPKQTSQGVVTVMVIPGADPVQPEAPRPDHLFLQSVCSYLSPRRILTTELHVRGPEYVPVWVSVGIDTVPGFDPAPVREAVKKEVQRFLSPLRGGFSDQGWPLGKTVDALEISASVTRVDGVSKVNQLRLAGDSGSELPEIAIEGLELPELKKVAVVEGDALTIEEIRGDVEESTEEGTNVVPVPVVPSEC